mmetsp:Transcript_76183/g.154405  ORF Transcript_76183/g.154405 Transcript_76183/m.154405 type:complete len:277 (+) Transcript_76183:132-962(+)
MVQLEPNMALTLKALAPFGAVVSAEQQAALDHSVTIKRVEAGLKSLVLWGKVTTLNGKDYLLAEGFNEPVLGIGGEVTYDSKFYFSVDAVKWVDLPAIDDETSKRAATIDSILTGDVAKAYEVQEDDPNAPPAPAEGEEPPADGEDGPKKLTFSIPELAVLRQRIDAINSACGVVPVNALQPNATNRIVPNRLFTGVAHPDKLESYAHRTVAPGGRTLAADLRGTWAVNYDPFRQVAAVRSLLFPGYTFYYSGHDASWGALYCGDGLRNDDLIFML